MSTKMPTVSSKTIAAEAQVSRMISIGRALTKNNVIAPKGSPLLPIFYPNIDQIHLHSSPQDSSCLYSQEDNFCSEEIAQRIVDLIGKQDSSPATMASVA